MSSASFFCLLKLTSQREFYIIFDMTGNKRSRRAAIGLASFLFAITFVQFCHSETNIFESRSCPVCQLNCASVGVAGVSFVFVVYYVFIETLVRVETPLRDSSLLDARVSRAPPLS